MTADCLEVVRSFVCTATGEQLGAACLHASTPNAALGPMRARPWPDASPALAQCEPGLGRMQARHNAVVAPQPSRCHVGNARPTAAWPAVHSCRRGSDETGAAALLDRTVDHALLHLVFNWRLWMRSDLKVPRAWPSAAAPL
jgi:hypothetical protein